MKKSTMDREKVLFFTGGIAAVCILIGIMVLVFRLSELPVSAINTDPFAILTPSSNSSGFSSTSEEDSRFWENLSRADPESTLRYLEEKKKKEQTVEALESHTPYLRFDLTENEVQVIESDVCEPISYVSLRGTVFSYDVR